MVPLPHPPGAKTVGLRRQHWHIILPLRLFATHLHRPASSCTDPVSPETCRGLDSVTCAAPNRLGGVTGIVGSLLRSANLPPPEAGSCCLGLVSG
ncbi:unnamed protein product [Discosporangium mesarthrocarpum]